MYAEDVWLRLRDARDELANNRDEDGLRKFVDVVVKMPKRIIPDPGFLSDAAAEELLDISDKFEAHKVGMSYDERVKEVPMETRYEHLNAHFIATNIQLGGVTWDAIVRIWGNFLTPYISIKHAFNDEAVTHYSVKGILSDVDHIMNLIEKYHGR